MKLDKIIDWFFDHGKSLIFPVLMLWFFIAIPAIAKSFGPSNLPVDYVGHTNMPPCILAGSSAETYVPTTQTMYFLCINGDIYGVKVQ